MVRTFIPNIGFTYDNYLELKDVIEKLDFLSDDNIILLNYQFPNAECDILVFSADSIHSIEVKRHTFIEGTPGSEWYYEFRGQKRKYESTHKGALENPFGQSKRIAEEVTNWFKKKGKLIFEDSGKILRNLRFYPWVISSNSSKNITEDVYCRYSAGISREIWEKKHRSWSDPRSPCNGIRIKLDKLEKFLINDLHCQEVTLQYLRSLKSKYQEQFREWNISDFKLLNNMSEILSDFRLASQFHEEDIKDFRGEEINQIIKNIEREKAVIIKGKSGTGKSILISQIAENWIENGGFVAKFPTNLPLNSPGSIPDDLLLIVDSFDRLSIKEQRVILEVKNKSNLLIGIQEEQLSRIQTKLADINLLDLFEDLYWYKIKKLPFGELEEHFKSLLAQSAINYSNKAVEIAINTSKGNLRFIYELVKVLKRENVVEFTKEYADIIPDSYLRLLLKILAEYFINDDDELINEDKFIELSILQLIAYFITIPVDVVLSLRKINTKFQNIPKNLLESQNGFFFLPHGGYDLLLLHPFDLLREYTQNNESINIPKKQDSLLQILQDNIDEDLFIELLLNSVKVYLRNQNYNPQILDWFHTLAILLGIPFSVFVSLFPENYWNPENLTNLSQIHSEEEISIIFKILIDYFEAFMSFEEKFALALILFKVETPKNFEALHLFAISRSAFYVINENNVNEFDYVIEKAINLYNNSSDKKLSVVSLSSFGSSLVIAQSFDRAFEILAILKEEFTHSNDDDVKLSYHALKCRYEISQLNYNEAKEAGESGLKLSKKLGKRNMESDFLHELAMITEQLEHDPLKGLEYLNQSIEISKELKDGSDLAQSYALGGDLCTFMVAKSVSEKDFKKIDEWLEKTIDYYVKSYQGFYIMGMDHRITDILVKFFEMFVQFPINEDTLESIKKKFENLIHNYDTTVLQISLKIFDILIEIRDGSFERTQKIIKELLPKTQNYPLLKEIVERLEMVSWGLL